MHRLVLVVAVVGAVLLPASASAQVRRFALESAQGLRALNVVVEPVTFKGRRAVRVTEAPALLQRAAYASGQLDVETLAWIEGLELSDGTIEVELAGVPAPGASGGARGFVGIAFRLQPDDRPDGFRRYDAFYLRPTNGRADDQERRNQATQYISHPDWPWFRLRRETPSRYESYVDLEPDTWTRMRIEVRGAQARLFVHDLPQPVLVVNDVKTGAGAKGAVALWVGPGTIAHFRNLVVTPAAATAR